MLSVRCTLAVAAMLLDAGAPVLRAQEKAKEILAMDQARLIQVLQNPQAAVFAKAKACQRLAVVGTRDAVPALAALLGDPQLGLYARFGLQPIPGGSVDEALRAALGKLEGRAKTGVIQSIGYRKDAKAIKPLVKLLDDGDADIAQAAAAALGQIGGRQAAKQLHNALGRAKAGLIPALADASLVCAEGLEAQGHRKQALALYRDLQGDKIPKPARGAAQRALARPAP